MKARARICLGAFAGAHGVKGEIKVKTFTESEDGVAAYGAVESEDGARRFTLHFIRVLKPGLALVSAPEIKTRDDAEALAGVRFYIDRAALPEADEEEFYIEDLVGLRAEIVGGGDAGRVTAVYNFGAGDLLELAGVAGRPGPVLVPFTRAAAPDVDLERGVISIAADALGDDALADEAAADPALVAEAMRQEDA